MSSFILKIIAIISMMFDHVGYIIFGKFTFMNYVGRLAFPIFAFGISEGYKNTKNLKKYFLRLFIFAIISQIPYMLFLNAIGANNFTFNIFFTLILGLLSITIYDKINNKYLGILVVILFSIFAQLFNFDYGYFGIATIFIFYLKKKKKILMNILFVIITFINYFYKYLITLQIRHLIIIVFCCLSLIPINLYNNKKGKNIKYVFYIFYPLHLILLYLVHILF